MDRVYDETSVFSQIWAYVRELYPRTMTAPEAARDVVRVLTTDGHEASIMYRNHFMVDGELYEIKKVRGHSRFDLYHHGVR